VHIWRASLVGLLAVAGASVTAVAQDYPTRPITLIVPFPAGGGVDVIGRIVGEKLSAALGQPVIIDNRGGAAGVIGTEMAAGAPPDGYTLFLSTLGNLAVNQHLYKMKVDPVQAFAPITQVVDVHFVAMANPAFPPNNIKELIALAKAKPGTINYASSGAGGAPHLALELIKSMAQVDIVHVPYKGSAPSLQDVIGGQVQLTCDSLVQGLPFIKNGSIKALGVLGKTRSPLLPDVPTFDESGLPGFELTNWFGLVAPAATPADILEKIHADVVRVLAMPEIREKFVTMGADAVGNTREEFGARMRTDSEKWARLIEQAHIKAD
jgi:tripartite-type tricarboxylate transporter receptor subunit TctC